MHPDPVREQHGIQELDVLLGSAEDLTLLCGDRQDHDSYNVPLQRVHPTCRDALQVYLEVHRDNGP